jgi:hypothetical protein
MGQHHGDRAEGRVSPSERLVSPHSCDTQPRKPKAGLIYPQKALKPAYAQHGAVMAKTRYTAGIWLALSDQVGVQFQKFEIIQIYQRWMAETEGFEPSIRLLTV